MNVNTQAEGTAAELIASAWLLRRGYDVFRNVSSTGPADLMAMNRTTGEILKLDSKKASISPSGTVTFTALNEWQFELGIRLIVVLPDGDCFFPEPKPPQKAPEPRPSYPVPEKPPYDPLSVPESTFRSVALLHEIYEKSFQN